MEIWCLWFESQDATIDLYFSSNIFGVLQFCDLQIKQLFFFVHTWHLILNPQVRQRRELLATELNERLLKNADLIPSTVLDFILDKIENLRAEGNIDSRLISQHMAFSIMGTTFFGDGFLAWPKAALYEELLMKIAKDACFWASYNVTPFWRRGFWRYQCLCTKLKSLTQDILQHCRKSCKLFHHIEQNVHSEKSNIEMGTAHGAKCCSDDGFQNVFRGLNDHNSAKEESYGNIMGVMYHGCQTTAALISSVLTRLVMHPAIQEQVQISSLCFCCTIHFISRLDQGSFNFNLLSQMLKTTRLV